MNQKSIYPDIVVFNNETDSSSVLNEKLNDAYTPGFQADFDPEEAAKVGAFIEDALSEGDATESVVDLIDSDKGNQHG
ncbi:conjugal transfer protein TraD [Yersinia enterocolitica]|nr:conjugal transfer protein TraD [Yersinia enterocolitica]ELX2238820.1 conjugal transfer protein TraD [Yersinia enterocolitica]